MGEDTMGRMNIHQRVDITTKYGEEEDEEAYILATRERVSESESQEATGMGNWNSVPG